MEYIGCLSNQKNNLDFSVRFLTHPLINTLPDGYDICFLVSNQMYNKKITFYLYDSTSPLINFDHKLIIGAVTLYVEYKDYVIDIEDESDGDVSISSLDTNKNLEEFNLRRSGIGTYLLYVAILYAKTANKKIISIDDMASYSDGFPRDNNIYVNIGFKYINETDPEMLGDVDKLYEKINIFLKTKMRNVIDTLNLLTEYFDDEEWNMVDNSDSDMELD